MLHLFRVRVYKNLRICRSLLKDLNWSQREAKLLLVSLCKNIYCNKRSPNSEETTDKFKITELRFKNTHQEATMYYTVLKVRLLGSRPTYGMMSDDEGSFVYTTPEKFENGAFTLKTHQMFYIHATAEICETQQSAAILDLCSSKTWSAKSDDRLSWCYLFRKAPRSKCSPSKLKRRDAPAVSNSSGLKSVYEKLRFRDGLVWMVRLNENRRLGEIKLRKFRWHSVEGEWIALIKDKLKKWLDSGVDNYFNNHSFSKDRRNVSQDKKFFRLFHAREILDI